MATAGPEVSVKIPSTTGDDTISHHNFTSNGTSQSDLHIEQNRSPVTPDVPDSQPLGNHRLEENSFHSPIEKCPASFPDSELTLTSSRVCSVNETNCKNEAHVVTTCVNSVERTHQGQGCSRSVPDTADACTSKISEAEIPDNQTVPNEEDIQPSRHSVDGAPVVIPAQEHVVPVEPTEACAGHLEDPDKDCAKEESITVPVGHDQEPTKLVVKANATADDAGELLTFVTRRKHQKCPTVCEAPNENSLIPENSFEKIPISKNEMNRLCPLTLEKSVVTKLNENNILEVVAESLDVAERDIEEDAKEQQQAPTKPSLQKSDSAAESNADTEELHNNPSVQRRKTRAMAQGVSLGVTTRRKVPCSNLDRGDKLSNGVLLCPDSLYNPAALRSLENNIVGRIPQGNVDTKCIKEEAKETEHADQQPTILPLGNKTFLSKTTTETVFRRVTRMQNIVPAFDSKNQENSIGSVLKSEETAKEMLDVGTIGLENPSAMLLRDEGFAEPPNFMEDAACKAVFVLENGDLLPDLIPSGQNKDPPAEVTECSNVVINPNAAGAQPALKRRKTGRFTSVAGGSLLALENSTVLPDSIPSSQNEELPEQLTHCSDVNPDPNAAATALAAAAVPNTQPIPKRQWRKTRRFTTVTMTALENGAVLPDSIHSSQVAPGHLPLCSVKDALDPIAAAAAAVADNLPAPKRRGRKTRRLTAVCEDEHLSPEGTL